MINLDKSANHFRQEGYVVFPDLVSSDKCEYYKELLEEDYIKYSTHYADRKTSTNHGLQDKSSEKVVFNLHNKNLAYYDLFDNKTLISFLDIVLKEGSYQNSEPYNLLNISARNPHKKAKGQQLHLDSNLPAGDYPIIVVALWMLDDFHMENGATRIVPGSHKNKGYAEDGKRYDNELTVTGKQGSLLVFNGSLWHGSSDKLIEGDRWAVILGYGRWFIKPSFDFSKNMPKSMYENLTAERKELLGFKSQPPIDEFTRMTRRSNEFEDPIDYKLPIKK